MAAQLTPVSYDPFASAGNAERYTPVDHDPFAAPSDGASVRYTPVEGDPFASGDQAHRVPSLEELRAAFQAEHGDDVPLPSSLRDPGTAQLSAAPPASKQGEDGGFLWRLINSPWPGDATPEEKAKHRAETRQEVETVQRFLTDPAYQERVSAAVGHAATGSLADTAADANLVLGGAQRLAGLDTDTTMARVHKFSEEGARHNELASDLSPSGAAAGNLLGLTPLLAGGEALLPERAAGFLRGAPVATGLAQQQAASQAIDVLNQGANTATAEKVYGASLPINTVANLIPVGVPGSAPIRAISGAVVGAGTGVGSQQAMHEVAPEYIQAPTVQSAETQGGLGAILALMHGRATAPRHPPTSDAGSGETPIAKSPTDTGVHYTPVEGNPFSAESSGTTPDTVAPERASVPRSNAAIVDADAAAALADVGAASDVTPAVSTLQSSSGAGLDREALSDMANARIAYLRRKGRLDSLERFELSVLQDNHDNPTVLAETLGVHVEPDAAQSAGAQPTNAETTNEPPAFFPEERQRQRAEDMITKVGGLSEEQAQALRDNYDPVIRDRVTDAHRSEELTPTIDAARQSGAPAAYAEIDIGNLGGLNAHTGSNSAADVHYRAIADLIRVNAERAGGDAVLIRKGGDELGLVFRGIDAQEADRVMAQSRADVLEYAKQNNLAEFQNPKGGDPGLGLHYGVSEITPHRDVSSILAEADHLVEARKKGEPYEYTGSDESAGSVTLGGRAERGSAQSVDGRSREIGGGARGGESQGESSAFNDPQPENVNPRAAGGPVELTTGPLRIDGRETGNPETLDLAVARQTVGAHVESTVAGKHYSTMDGDVVALRKDVARKLAATAHDKDTLAALRQLPQLLRAARRDPSGDLVADANVNGEPRLVRIKTSLGIRPPRATHLVERVTLEQTAAQREADAARIAPLREEIGWSEWGGRLLRAPLRDNAGAHGDVIGRTQWIPKAGPNGEESSFWRERPVRLSEAQAHAAMDKHAAGERLTVPEQRFIQYARDTADRYDAEYRAAEQEFATDRAEMTDAMRTEALAALREHDASIAPEDLDEALTLSQWIEKAHHASVDARDLIDATWDGTAAEQVQKITQLIRNREDAHGTDQGATPGGRANDPGTDRERQTATRAETGSAHQHPEEEFNAAADVTSPADVHTIDSLRNELGRSRLGRQFRELERADALRLIADRHQVFAGRFDGRRLFLNATYLAHGEGLSTALHEVVHREIADAHGLRAFVGPREFDRLQRRLDTMKAEGGAAAKLVLQAEDLAAKSGEQGARRSQERVTYFVQLAREAQRADTLPAKAALLYRQVISAIRVAVYDSRFGTWLRSTGHGLELTANDFVALAENATRRQARVAAHGGEPAAGETSAYARPHGFASADLFGGRPTEPAPEALRPAPENGDLFGGATARDHVDGAVRAKDDALRGANTSVGMKEGDGELFAGARPEQVEIRENEAHYDGDASLSPPARTGELPEAERPGLQGHIQSTGPVQGTLDFFAPEGAKPAAPKLAQRVVNVRVGHFASGVTQVRSWQDAAHIVAPLRKNAAENMIALVLDGQGKPIAVIRHTIGTTDAASVYPSILGGAIVKTPGAREVYFAHNHPSGTILPSEADRTITRELTKVLADTGIESKGMIIVAPGSRRAGFFGPEGHGDDTSPVPAKARTESVPVTERRLRKTKAAGDPYGVIGNPAQARAVVEKMDGPGVVLLDTRHHVIGELPMSDAEMRLLRTGRADSGTGKLLGELSEANAGAYVVRADSDQAADNMMRWHRTVDPSARQLDVFVRNGDRFVSTAEQGRDPSSGPFNAMPSDRVRDALDERGGADHVPSELSDKVSLLKLATNLGGAVKELLPGTTPVQEAARNVMRSALAKRDRAITTFDKATAAFVKYYDRQMRVTGGSPLKAMKDAIEFEKGQPISDPNTRPFYAYMRKMLDAQAAQIRSFGAGYLDHLVTDYFPHLWGDPERAAAFYGAAITRKPLGGNKEFTRERVVDSLEDGIKSGMTPLTRNPAELVLMRYASGEKLLTQLRVMKELEDQGYVHKVAPGGRVPRGFAHVNDPAFGDRVVPEMVAKDMNNYLDPGLTKYKFFRGFRAVENLLLTARLGVSAFHAGMTTFDTIATHVDIGFRRLLTLNDLPGALREFAKVPVAVVTSPLEGGRLVKQFFGQAASDPHTAAVLDMLTEGGARGYMNAIDYNNHFTKMVRAWRQGDAAGKLTQTLPGLMEASTRLISHKLVPAQKMTARVLLAKFKLDEVAHALGRERGDYAGIIEAMDQHALREMAYDINSTVDDRLGQFAYDNIFLNKTFRDFLHATVQSVGWNFGTFRLLGGGLADLRQLVKPAKYASALDKAGKVTSFDKSRFTNRLAYLLVFNAVAAATNATLQYALTGKAPDQIKDLFAFRTGRKNDDGSDERWTLPTYQKDEWAVTHHPIETLGHKLHPMLGLMRELLENRDYFGTQVYDPAAPLPKEAKQILTYLAKGFEPYSVQGMMKNRENDAGALSKLVPFIGINPAPADISRSAFNEFVSDNYFRRQKNVRTIEEAEHSRAHGQAIQDVREGRKPDTSGLTKRQQGKLQSEARTEMLEFRFRRLDLPEQVRAYELATPEERKEFHLRNIVNNNLASRLEGLPRDEQTWLQSRIRAVNAVDGASH